MKWHLAASSLVVLIAGCGAATLPSESGGNGPYYSVVKTPTSQCTGPASSGDTIIGSWTAELSDSAGDMEVVTYNFQADTISLTVTCQYTTGLTMQASVTGEAESQANDQLFIPAAQQYLAPPQTDSTGVQRTCDALISQGTVSYTFTGPCLSVQFPGFSLEMVRSGG